MPEWTFLTNHAVVLSLIANQPRITALELSQKARITERAVRKIIADLASSEYISVKKEGNRNTYSINTDLPLRHHTQRETAIGDFLTVLGWGDLRSENTDNLT